MSRGSGGDADRLIARLPVDRRLKVLDAVAHATQHGSTVAIEHSYFRTFADAETVVGRIVGVAYCSGGGSSIELIVKPVDTEKRMLAIPAAHLLRIRWAHDPSGQAGPDPSVYDLGEVLAGPPR